MYTLINYLINIITHILKQSKLNLLKKSSTYFDFNVTNNDNDPKFLVSDLVETSKY